ncbi:MULTISPECIES: outer membrane protein [unclassified Bartonella]
MTDNVLLRAEYHYSDFCKKQFAKDEGKLGYKTNGFRVSIAYKF